MTSETDTDSFVAVNWKLVVTEADGRRFCFVTSSETKYFAFGLVERATEREVTLRLPDEQVFARLEKNGTLKGIASEEDPLSGLFQSAVRVHISTRDLEKISDMHPINVLFPECNKLIISRERPPYRSDGTDME